MERFKIEDLVKVSAKLTAEEIAGLCDVVGVGLMNLDVATGDILLNRNLTLLTGYEPGELPHSADTKVMLTFEDDRPRVGAAMSSLMSGQKDSYQLEYRMRRKDGSIVSVSEYVTVAERDKDGNVKRLIGIGMDLSKLKWAEEKARMMEAENRRIAKKASQSELEEQNRMLRAANSAAAMIIGGLHQDYDLVLQQSLQILGESIQADRASIWRNREADGKLYCFHRAEWAKNTASPYIGTDQLYSYNELLPNWENLVRDGHELENFTEQLTSAFETRIKTANDVKSMVSIPLFLHGEFWGFILFEDCTAVRGFTLDEKEIMASGALVIASSISRNETFGKLNEARRNAMESTRAKGEFLSRMSHEIRTPMNAIIGMTTIAKRTDNPAKIRYCLDKVDSSSRQLLGIINDVLDMSKIEANKLDISKAPFDFEKMIQYVINMMQVKLDEKHQDLRLDISEAIGRYVISDELRLSQVLINLISNAVKFTPVNGKITLRIRETDQSEDQSTFRIEVIDTGIGIEKEQRDRLFESFEQADGSITRKFGGTGLGLAISKKIINLMGGEIWVESTPGEGSRFIFNIEVGWGDKLPVSDLITELPSSMRVLVVDDKEDVLEYFKNMLNSFSVSCDIAADGEKAVDMVRKSMQADWPYDIVFIDWNMPNMNGAATAAKIKKLVGDDIICVMISVSEWCDIEQEAKACGVTNFLSKPVLPSVLYNTILELTNKNLMTPKSDDDASVPDLSGKRILIAEDMEINREIMATVLEETGAEVAFAEDGLEALKQFNDREHPLDMILMDVQMPNMDGLEATRSIRASRGEIGKNIPIIAMTANAFKEDEKMCLAAGMDAYLSKPLNVDQLYIVLKKYI